MSTITHTHASSQVRPQPTHHDTTRALLTCGILAGPLFVGSSLLQALLRPGFDLTRHGISMLLLGGFGWIQVVTFELAGLYAIAGAIGARRRLHPGRAATSGPRLLSGYGIGLLVAGLFAPDPAFAFPPGTPDGMPAGMSGHAALHALGFFVSISSFIAAAFVFARRFLARRERAWAAYSAASGVAAPLLVILSIVMAPSGGIPLFGVALVTAAWMSAASSRLLAEST